MQSLECVELLLFVLLPKMSVPDIKNLVLTLVIRLRTPCTPGFTDIRMRQIYTRAVSVPLSNTTKVCGKSRGKYGDIL